MLLVKWPLALFCADIISCRRRGNGARDRRKETGVWEEKRADVCSRALPKPQALNTNNCPHVSHKIILVEKVPGRLSVAGGAGTR